MTRTLFSVMGIAGAAALFFLYTQPAYDNAKTIQAQIAEYDQALDKAAELQRLKQTLLSRRNAFNPTDLERLHKMLPDHVDNVRLVLDLDSLAGKHNLALQNVVIDGERSGTVEETVVGTIGASREKFGSLTLKFATQGTYPQFVNFMRDLESSLRIVDVTNLSIDQFNSENATEPQYRFDLTLKTYWLK